MQNAKFDEAQGEIKIAGRKINNLRYADDTTLMAESEEEPKSLLMKVKEKSEKASWKLNIQKTKIMASCPITSWQIDEETMETVTNYLLDSKITADGGCSHEIKRLLLLRRKAVMNLAAAATAAKSLQSCPTLCNPIDGSLPGSPINFIFIFIYHICIFTKQYKVFLYGLNYFLSEKFTHVDMCHPRSFIFIFYCMNIALLL